MGYSLILPSSVFGVMLEESRARLVLPCTAIRAKTAIAREKSTERKLGGHGDEHLSNERTRNTRNRTACTGRLEKPGPKTLETQEILEQTKNLLLSRTNAYGDGCFRAASKRGPSGSIEEPRFVPIPCPACGTFNRSMLRMIGEMHRRADAGLREI